MICQKHNVALEFRSNNGGGQGTYFCPQCEQPGAIAALASLPVTPQQDSLDPSRCYGITLFDHDETLAIWSNDSVGHGARHEINIGQREAIRRILSAAPTPPVASQDGWNAGIEAAAKVAEEAELPEGYQWGHEAMSSFNFGKKRAVAAIRALTKPASVSQGEEPRR